MDNLIIKKSALREIVNDTATKRILASLELPENCKCLELGVGIGSIASHLASLFPRGEVHTFDLNPQNIQQIGRRYQHLTNLKTYVSDVHAPCYEDERYDLIHARFLLEHLSDWEDVVARLCKANLKPGGILFLEDAVYSQIFGYVGGDAYEHVMVAYSNAVSGDGKEWNCALQIPRVLGRCGLIDIQAFGEMQTFFGNTIDSEYWKCCFFENREQLFNLGVQKEELYSVLQELGWADKYFSGPVVFHSYGRKKACENRQQNDTQAPIKMVLTDCDGCLTDAGMYYAEDGEEVKKFSTRDGMGFAMLREQGIATGIITGENVKLVARRAEKLKLDILEMGCKEKLAVIRRICEERKIRLENVAYIGDDLNDIEALSMVGLSCCPSDAMERVKVEAAYIAKAKGGEGVLREVAELVLKINASSN